ncbi:MAG: flagellar basal body L-ring protein FlgH [Gemmatimonadetes bacterium]|nr:flagellar basal body L-ring protein FlgH [Gemmatimonadota bacterium]
MTRVLLGLAVALVAAGPLGAQTPDSTRVADSTRAADSARAAAKPVVVAALPRAAWFSDRLPLRVGDLLTVVVDEATAASERVSTTASADRNQRAKLGIGIDEAVRLGPAKDFSTGMANSSSDVGEAGRRGQLTAVLTVRVTGVDASGIATIEGTKSVTVDGRAQQVQLKGLVRAEDVSANNLVSSTRVADAVITYNGKKIGPRSGILGKILSIFWP